MIRRISSFWLIFIIIVLTNMLILGVNFYLLYVTAVEEVSTEQQKQLQGRAQAEARAIENQLREFEAATQLAASEAEEILLEEVIISDEAKAERLSRIIYDDELGIWGMDDWYYNQYRPEFKNELLSNVFINGRPVLDERLEYLVTATEELDPLFETVLERDLNTQWIYLTTREGMMRLYPWHDNNYTFDNPDWQPQEASFYTVAEPDPRAAVVSTEPVWTDPYIDCAGAGLMVTNSVPIYDREQSRLLGVMSHDFLIDSLQEDVIGFQVGERVWGEEERAGFAFLVDDNGNVIAHPNYDVEGIYNEVNAEESSGDVAMMEMMSNLTPAVTEGLRELGCAEPIAFPLSQLEGDLVDLIDDMLAQRLDIVRYTDNNNNRWVVAHDTVPTTDWHLALVLSEEEAAAPAYDILQRMYLIGGLLMVVFVILAAVASRYITRPILKLSEAAREIEDSVDKNTAQALQDTNLKNIMGPFEVNQLVSVFGQMVQALYGRMRELDTIYAIGQTMTANLDYEEAMRGVLDAVADVVDYDAGEVAILEDGELVVYAWRGKADFKDTTGRRYKVGVGITGRMAETKQSVYKAVIDDDSDGETQRTLATSVMSTEMIGRSERLEINSYLGIPLMVKKELIGVLTLVHHEPHHFTESDQRQLLKLTAQASVAIYNSLRVRAREDELKDRIQQLQIRVSDAQRSRETETLINAQYFQSLREQARELRLRRKKARVAAGEETEIGADTQVALDALDDDDDDAD